MKKYYIYLLLIVAIPVLSSCSDWFDVSPKSQVKADDLFETEEGFKRALIGVYTLMADNNAYGRNGTMTFMEVLSGAYTSPLENTSNTFNKAAKYDYAVTANETIIKNLWSTSYNTIANANNILDNIDERQEMFTNSYYEIIKGEALGLRAYLHFDLLRNFAPAPVAFGLDAYAIPYVDHITTVPFKQSTVGEVLERVIEDLEDAKEILKDCDPIGPAFESYEENLYGNTSIDQAISNESFLLYRQERMNYYAVVATLARVYMYRGEAGDMEEALACANEVIDAQKVKLKTAAVIDAAAAEGIVMNHMAQEYIFSLFKRNLSAAVNTTYFYINTTTYNNNLLEVNETARAEYFETDLYGVADVRYNRLFGVNVDGISYYLKKYNFSSNNVKRVPMIKISEMYLIAAEASESIDYLKLLQRSRGLKTGESTITLREELDKEYRKEFLGEGQMFYYFKRHNQLVNDEMKSTSSFVFPIPDTEEELGLIN